MKMIKEIITSIGKPNISKHDFSNKIITNIAVALFTITAIFGFPITLAAAPFTTYYFNGEIEVSLNPVQFPSFQNTTVNGSFTVDSGSVLPGSSWVEGTTVSQPLTVNFSDGNTLTADYNWSMVDASTIWWLGSQGEASSQDGIHTGNWNHIPQPFTPSTDISLTRLDIFIPKSEMISGNLLSSGEPYDLNNITATFILTKGGLYDQIRMINGSLSTNPPVIDDPDSDGDGVPDSSDVCPTGATNDADDDGICGSVDNCPAVANTDQADTDNDGVGDACNQGDDNDGDEWNNELDNCPSMINPAQTDTDLDGTGDVCDSCSLDPANDADGDGICGDVDNCPITANSDQADTPDGDAIGNVCDLDDDNDGAADDVDNCPLTSNDQSDYDGDGQGDACDDDVDGDNINDAVDACLNTTLGALVNHTGCELTQLCPCDNNWRNHGAYVKCVAHQAKDFLKEGLISDSVHGAIVSNAANSQCGSKK